MKDLLEQSLRSDESTPVHQITPCLGHPDDAYIRRQLPELCEAIDRTTAQAKKNRFEKMRPILKTAIDENPVPSLAEVARRLGYSYSAIVQRHEPRLCKQLMERRRVYIATRIADLERQALAALEQSPPPSVRAVLQRLGHHGAVYARALPNSRALHHWAPSMRFGPEGPHDVILLAYVIESIGNQKLSARSQLPCSRRLKNVVIPRAQGCYP